MDNAFLPAAVLEGSSSVLQFATGRLLDHRLFDTEEEAEAWRGATQDEWGRDTMRMGWTRDRLDALDLRVGSESWASGFQHELVVHLMAGGTLPFLTPHAGQATATLVSNHGHLLTNFHLVSASIWFHDRTDPKTKEAIAYPTINSVPHEVFVAEGVPAPHMDIFTAQGESLGPVRLCYHDAAIDLAILKLETVPKALRPARLRDGPAVRHERIWQFGYPPRTARPQSMKTFLGYEDARGELTYSPGLLLSDPHAPLWYTDADVTFGSSGSAVIGDDGALIGVRCGGGARSLPRDEWFKYNRVTDVAALRRAVPDAF